MRTADNQKVFIDLLRAGLWEKDIQLSQYEHISLKDVYLIAQEQAVLGLVAAGLEHVIDEKIPKEDLLSFAGTVLQLEQRNLAMNEFLCRLVNHLRDNGIHSLLVKGQGIGQCYERPLWRQSGDIDLLSNVRNYEKAKLFFYNSFNIKDLDEDINSLHWEAFIDGWEIELHGSICTHISNKIDKYLELFLNSIFDENRVRTWYNNGGSILLPDENDDVIIVFSHILKHLFHGGVGLRQLCDLTRLLWFYRSTINSVLLEKRLRELKLLSEWKAYSAFAVHYLGMPEETMPLYFNEKKWRNKAKRIYTFILKTGSFGKKRDNTFYIKYPLLINKTISLSRHTSDALLLFRVFPLDAIRVWGGMIKVGFREVVKGRKTK